ncbi:MAG: hypothetical protein KGJ35_03335, partial [Patescibacteria group bacterium]|nr:hypothetical protein [Patescibacteria group bacterium]
MIVKINDRTPAHLERLEKFFNSGNWVHVPKQLFIKPMSDDELREYEHKFAKVLRKTKTSKAGSADRFTITLEISPYVYDEGGCQVKVPA